MADAMAFAQTRLRDGAALVIGNASPITAHGTSCVYIRRDIFDQLLKAFNDMRDLEDALNATTAPHTGEDHSSATTQSQDT